MKRCSIKSTSIKTTIVMLGAAVALLTPTLANATNLWWVKGGNWADARDNYNTGWVIPSGLTSSETLQGAVAKADEIASNIKYVGGNMVRVPINPPSVASAQWWFIIQVYVNELIYDGLYVDMCCWTEKNTIGTVDDPSAWDAMWETVDSVYHANYNVFYEPINEPFEYIKENDVQAQIDLYYSFITSIVPDKDQGRILLDGTGYADHLADIGSQSSLSGCDLSLHIYPYWDHYTSVGAWETALNNRVGGYQNQACVTEMGALDLTSLNYQSSSSNTNICFIQGVGAESKNLQIGNIYWPMWKDGDGYRLFVNTDNGQWVNWSLMEQFTSTW